MEWIFASNNEPILEMNRVLDNLTEVFEKSLQSGIINLGNASQENITLSEETVEKITGNHYGRLFEGFSLNSFFDEPKRLLFDRLDRNSISIDNLSQMNVLDAGCGGGRYSVAWRLLGANHVTGIDISDINICDAQNRVEDCNINNVIFKQINALDLPFDDNSFDIVFSNGVLHHTTDWEKGVGELIRVLKPGGLGWLYLIENPGGLFWDTIEILRVIMQNEKKETALQILKSLGYPGNRLYYMLDHVMVPINTRLTPREVEQRLTESGAVKIRRLTRGTDFDRIEKIAQQEPYADIKYGVGENRYVFSKL